MKTYLPFILASSFLAVHATEVVSLENLIDELSVLKPSSRRPPRVVVVTEVVPVADSFAPLAGPTGKAVKFAAAAKPTDTVIVTETVTSRSTSTVSESSTQVQEPTIDQTSTETATATQTLTSTETTTEYETVTQDPVTQNVTETAYEIVASIETATQTEIPCFDPMYQCASFDTIVIPTFDLSCQTATPSFNGYLRDQMTLTKTVEIVTETLSYEGEPMAAKTVTIPFTIEKLLTVFKTKHVTVTAEAANSQVTVVQARDPLTFTLVSLPTNPISGLAKREYERAYRKERSKIRGQLAKRKARKDSSK